MLSAQLITIGTEITSGEVVNTNAAWLSRQLEDMGLRVLSHLSVRDQRDEILGALESADAEVIIVTGGLGPTSDDITRDCLAAYTNCPLEFDDSVWADLKALYEKRQLPLREAHRWQCHFPLGSERLLNPVGTALGFYQLHNRRHYFVLPGPPRELEGMWQESVRDRLLAFAPRTSKKWIKWTCLGAPESEVAEVVEPAVQNSGLEVGYRAQLPYVKVKVYAESTDHEVIGRIESALSKWIVGRGEDDLAIEFLKLWPVEGLRVCDEATQGILVQRLLAASAELSKAEESPKILFSNFGGLPGDGLWIRIEGDEFVTRMNAGVNSIEERKSLPYKIPLSSERGRKSIAEWALWAAVKRLRTANTQS